MPGLLCSVWERDEQKMLPFTQCHLQRPPNILHRFRYLRSWCSICFMSSSGCDDANATGLELTFFTERLLLRSMTAMGLTMVAWAAFLFCMYLISVRASIKTCQLSNAARTTLSSLLSKALEKIYATKTTLQLTMSRKRGFHTLMIKFVAPCL